MTKKQLLELTWVGKNVQPRLEPRILLEDHTCSYHAKRNVSGDDIFDSRLIYGDNLLALKALEQEFTGVIKCIYIDPPFNTKQAYDHYDDGVEHSIWLSLMRNRIEMLHRLLAQDGSFFVHIDDNELGYLIALTDEIFGRANRVSVITFKQSSASGPKAMGIVTTNNFILYYVKDKACWEPNRVYTAADRDDRYSKYIANFDAPFEEWELIPLREAFLASETLASWAEVKKRYGDELEARLNVFVLDNATRVVRTARVAPKDVNEDARRALDLSVRQAGTVFRSDRAGRRQLLLFKRRAIDILQSKDESY